MKRFCYGMAIVLCYTLLYWVIIALWSLAGFARIGGIAERIDFVLRIAAIPFLVGAGVAFLFRHKVEIWALGIAPFVFSALLHVTTDMDWHEIKGGVLGFWVVSTVAAAASIAGGVVERRAQVARRSRVTPTGG